MSQENVERTRAAMAAFSENDLETALEAVHPDVVWRPLNDLPDSEVYVGREGVRSFWQLWHDSFRGLHLHLEACVSVGEDHVIATTRAGGEGSESGIGVKSVAFFQLLEFRDGRLIRLDMFRSEAEALEAVGLSE